MNIISQKFEIVLKNRLENRIKGMTSQFVDELLKSIVNPQVNSNNMVNIISKSNEFAILVAKEVIIEVINEFDESYRDSVERKRMYNINKSKLPRTIVTAIGEITFKRTYYETKDKSEYYAYIDDLLKLPKYDHYDPIVKGLAIRECFYTSQSQAGRIIGERITSIKDLTNKDTDIYKIPRQSVNNWLNDWNVTIQYEKENKTPKELYIMVDEKFVGSQDLEGDIMGKCFVVFEGVKQVSKGRRALINRHIFTFYSQKPWEDLLDKLGEIYNYDEIKNFYVLSDGGNWITSGISELELESFQKVEHLLCLFHFKQAINHITTVKEEREDIYKSFVNDKRKVFKSKLNKFVEKYPHKKETIEKKIKYILSHYQAAKHMLTSNIGSSMESHISHFIASTFASRPKGYSSKNIDKYFMLNDAKNNGINLFNTFLQTYNIELEDKPYSETTNSTSALGQEESWLPVVQMPILNSSQSIERQVIMGLSRIDSEIRC